MSPNFRLQRDTIKERRIMSPQTEATMNHFSHPEHPLQLISNHQNSTPISCSGCKSSAIGGTVYGCKTCNYFLHAGCAKMPREITHPFDKGHVFTLRQYGEGLYNYCDACGKKAGGFCYHCKICKTEIHAHCASTPLTFSHGSHPHQLKLLFSSPHPDKKFRCDVCNAQRSNHWLYRCDICDFDVHLGCKNVPIQANFGAFPNQAPIPQAHTVQQQPGCSSKSAPQVPPHPHPHFHPQAQAQHYQYFHSPYAATGFPVNHGMDPAAVAFIQRLQAHTAAQNQMNQHQLQAIFAGGRGGRTGGFGGDLIQQLLSGLGNGVGTNIPGLGNGGGLNLQGLLGGGGGGGLDLGGLLGGGGGLDLGGLLGGGGGGGLDLGGLVGGGGGLDLGGLLGGFSF